MKTKASIIFVSIFMTTAIFAAQVKDVPKQTNNQSIVASQNTRQQTAKNNRGIIVSKTNWSKIKDMFM